jgi:hypothetical protein
VQTHLLTVAPGFRGSAVAAPALLVEEHGRRWLVAADGEAAWARTGRALGRVTFATAGKREIVEVREMPWCVAADVIERYVAHRPVVRPTASSPDPVAAFEADFGRQTVFRLAPSACSVR